MPLGTRFSHTAGGETVHAEATRRTASCWASRFLAQLLRSSGQVSEAPSSVPRMPDGHPDLQGVWANNNMTPLERPKQFGLRATMTDAEFAAVKKNLSSMIDGGDAFFADELILAAVEGKTKFSSARHADRQLRPGVAVGTHPRQPHLAHHRPARRPHSAAGAGRRRAGARAGRGAAEARPRRFGAGHGAQHALRPRRHAEPPRRLSELLRDHAGAGRRGAPHRDDPRHAHLPDQRRPALSKAITMYHGDSRARWEGDTLVVDTTNFSPNANFRGSTDRPAPHREVHARVGRHHRVHRDDRRSRRCGRGPGR